MATRKNNWLNAKPVSKTGGKSGGARNPAKPYNKPASTSGSPKVKTKSQKLQQAAKTKPSSPAPKQVIKKPVTRTGPVKGPVPPKGYSAGAAGMPNSAKAKANLPKAGARAERTATRANQLIKDARAKGASSPKPSPASGAASASAKAVGGLKGAMGRLGRLAGPIGIGMTGADLAERAGYARGGKNYREFTRAQDKAPTKPVKNDPNGRSSRGINTTNGRTVATGSQQYNDYRNKEIAANRERLKGVGNPPAAKPKPPAPTQSRGGSTQSRSGGGGTSRPSSPARQSTPAMPKKPFTGTVSEGRKMWAEKYSSSKYDGQAIQKEAKALLKKMKEEKNNQSSAQRAGWDGNKNY